MIQLSLSRRFLAPADTESIARRDKVQLNMSRRFRSGTIRHLQRFRQFGPNFQRIWRYMGDTCL